MTATSTVQEKIQQRLCEMIEAELTSQVLVALYRALGFHSVDYYGGPHEKGKDLICWRKDELDLPELVVVQVKRFKFSVASSDPRSFPEVVNQLEQALETPVPSIDGKTYLPALVHFVTPYAVDTRALETRFHKYQTLRASRVKIIDGPLLAQLLHKHLRSLVQTLLGTGGLLTAATTKTLSNRDLLTALNRNGIFDISHIYCDLRFAVGRITSKLFFGIPGDAKAETIDIPAAEANSLLAACKIAEDKLQVFPLDKPAAILEAELIQRSEGRFENFKKRADLERQAANPIGSLSQLSDSLNDCRVGLTEQLEKSVVPIIAGLDVFSQLQKPTMKEALERTMPGVLLQDYVRSASLQSLHRAEITEAINNTTTDDSKLFDEIKQQIRRATKLYELRNGIAKMQVAMGVSESKRALSLSSSNLPSPREMGRFIRGLNRDLAAAQLQHRVTFPRLQYASAFEILHPLERKLRKLANADIPITLKTKVNGILLRTNLHDHYKWFVTSVKRLNDARTRSHSISKFLDRCSVLLSGWDGVLNNKIICNAIGLTGSQMIRPILPDAVIDLALKDVFDADRSVVLFGPAGSGKTTTLQMYAKSLLSRERDSELIIYAPLAHVVLHLELQDRLRQPLKDDSTALLEEGLCLYLQLLGVNLLVTDLLTFLSEKRTVLILDGIDEAINRAPWIVDAIVALATRYPKVQILTSSREGSPEINRLTFLGLTLQPFTPEQRDEFIRAWFKGKSSSSSREILAHLRKHPPVAEMVTNPLNATILCVLADHEVPLPDREIRLYEERLRLLLGHYDIAKRINRIKSSITLLENVARKIAFGLHSDGLRYAQPTRLANYASPARQNKAIDYEIAIAVKELYDPCNVLLPITDLGEQGFGHLRFQEFLVAKELAHRSINTTGKHLADPWWKGAFVLLAQDPDQIDRFIEWFSDNYGVLESLDTLKAMISVRPEEEQMFLRDRLQYFVNNERDLAGSELDEMSWTVDPD